MMTRLNGLKLWLLSTCLSLCTAQSTRQVPFRGPQGRPGPWSPDLILPHRDYIENRTHDRSTRSALWREFDRGYYDVETSGESSSQSSPEKTRMISSFINAARYAISFPKRCEFEGGNFECRFGLSCWLRGGSSVDLCGGGSVWTCCVPERKSSEEPEGNVLVNPECGRTYMREARIIGGVPAKFGEQPWQVALIRQDFFSQRLKCGGALISDRYVLTAAHCVEMTPSIRLRVRLGEHDRMYRTEAYPHEDHFVKRTIIHERFNRKLIAQDIALLELTAPIQFRKHIIPICLPQQGDTFAHEIATVSGWGWLDSNRKLMPTLLHKVDVRVLENEVCRSWISAYGFESRIKDDMLCAGFRHGGKDSCQGDSGGPLYLKRRGRTEVIGIVSWGLKCGRPSAPGVYTRVSEYVNWIHHQIGNDSRTTPSPSSPYSESMDTNSLEFLPPEQDQNNTVLLSVV